MTRPDIILIYADNQQAATLGCYGNPEIHSPNLDRMAAQGVRFDNAYCANAFCSPCRASLMTGLMPSAHGVHAWIDDRRSEAWPKGWDALDGIPTLPELLRAQGYRTGLFGKYHLGDPSVPARGWDRWVTMADGHVRSFYDNRITDEGETYAQPGHSVDFFTDKAIEWLGATEGPKFAYVPLPAPYGHWPATNDGQRNRFAALYDDCPMHSIPREGLSAAAVAHYDRIKGQSGGGLDFSMLMRAPNHLPTLRNYYSQISMIDDAVGRIMAAAPDALILYSADHGLSLGHHGFWGHGAATYPSNLHLAAHSVPLIARGPGVVASGVSNAHVGTPDLFATVLDLAGAQAPDGIAGRSFTPALGGSPMPAMDAVIAEQEETRVIRTSDWLYFQRFGDLGDALYDLRDDPGETVNLADDPDCAGVLADLRARVDACFDAHARPRADLWRGGRPLQNATMGAFWREAWGDDWAPVLGYG